MSQDLLRLIDSICRDKNIERESFVNDLENAMASAIRKEYDADPEVEVLVQFDPLGGHFSASIGDDDIAVRELGRIAAQTAKQVIIQKTRERERNSIYEDFSERRGSIVSGNVVRAEGGNLLVNIGRTEGFLPRSEQIPGETHQVGDRLRALILEVRELPNQVKVILSRSHPEFILRLFEVEVPEVAERVIEIKALAREAGYRTKVAVTSIDSKVDAVGACVGVRGSRIKNIVEELNNEKIDIVRWNESSQILIQNALKPAEVAEIALCFELGKATVVVNEDQLSLAIGKRGQNVRLAARLTGWDIDIMTPEAYDKNLETMARIVKSVEGTDDVIVDKLIAMGCISALDVDDLGPDPMISEMELSSELAEAIAEACGEEVIRQEEEKEAKAKAEAEARAAGLPIPGETPAPAPSPSPAPSAFVADPEQPEAAESAPENATPTSTDDTSESVTESLGDSSEDATVAETPADLGATSPDPAADAAEPIATDAPAPESAEAVVSDSVESVDDTVAKAVIAEPESAETESAPTDGLAITEPNDETKPTNS